MRLLFQPETLNKLPSRSQEKSRICEDILVVGQPPYQLAKTLPNEFAFMMNSIKVAMS